MQTASLVRFSATPIGRKFVLQGQINNPTILATVKQHMVSTVLTRPATVESPRAYVGNVREDKGLQIWSAAAPRCDKPALR
jgi:hypothetical protein